MVFKLGKNSPSLVDLKGSGRTRKKFIIPKKKYIVAYDKIAAYERREKTDYEAFINKITSVMLEEFVDYLKKEKCAEKIIMNKERCNSNDFSQVSLVSPAPSVSVIDDEKSIHLSSQSDEESEFVKNISSETKTKSLQSKSQELNFLKEKGEGTVKLHGNEEARRMSIVSGGKKKSISEPKGKGIVEPKGKGVAEPKRKSVTEPKGKSVTDPKGKSVTDPKRKSVTDSKGKSSPELKRKSETESKRKSVSESKRKSASETKRDNLLELKKKIPESKRKSVIIKNSIKTDVLEESTEKKIMEEKTKTKVGPTMPPSPVLESDSLDVNVDALFKNGNRYQGRLSCYLMEGEATYIWKDGTTYKGTFKDGIAEGLGLIKWPDGSWYDGEIKRNQRHGKGVSVLKIDGKPKMCYFGNWKHGRTNGKGMLIYGKGNWYDGYWKNGLHDGFGLRQYPSGSQYLGEWKKGQEHGWGTMMWANRDIYTGYWYKGKMEGRGTYVWRCVKGNGFVHPMQNTFIGNWKKGLRHGNGSLLLANGAMIHTVWVKGVKEGPGQIICKNGMVIQSSHLFKADKVYKLDFPIMIPFWNIWYCHFLSSYRSGLFYVQQLEENSTENEEKVIVPQETPDKHNICSNNIPIFAPVESLPLWDIVMKTVCQPIPDLVGEISYVIRPEDVELLSTEEMWLRKVITNRIADINCLYQHYSTIACEKKPKFKACMFRIMLWQMCRDCGIDQTSFSLCELDRETGCDSYPFAIVLVFQMIHYLLVLAHELCVKNRLTNELIPGKWGGAFDYFLTNYALPGMQKTSLIPELCNTIPLRNILSLYDNIGIPVTVGKVLHYFLSNRFLDPRKPKVQSKNEVYGQNKVYPDGRIIFEEVGGTLLGTVFDFQDSDGKYLCFDEIKLLGKKELAWTLFTVCPKAKNGNIPKSTYEVSFLEFCEFIKICLQKYKAIIDPDTEVRVLTKLAKCDHCNRYVEIRRHYKLEHKTKKKNEDEEERETTSQSSDTNEEFNKSTLINEIIGNPKTPSDKGSVEGRSQENLNDHGNYRLKKRNDDGCPCKDSEFVAIHESSATKICRCEMTCDCSCNNLKNPEESESFEIIEKHDSTSSENSFATSRQYKDAKAITVTACDSDCQCFCHEIPEYHEDEERFNDNDESESSDDDNLDEDLFGDTVSAVKVSDAINYLCGKTSEDDEAVDEDDFKLDNDGLSDDKTNTDRYTDVSDFESEEMGEEFGEEELFEEDNILAGEDFIEATKQFITDLEKFRTCNKSRKKIYEKLLQYNCPIFKIKYSEFFKNVNTKGMTRKELKEGLELESQDDLLEEQDVEDIEKEIINESIKVVKLVAKQRLYEKLLMGQFKKTILQTETGEYWGHFVDNPECDCLCENCLSGECLKKNKATFVVKDREYETSSDSSVSIL